MARLGFKERLQQEAEQWMANKRREVVVNNHIKPERHIQQVTKSGKIIYNLPDSTLRVRGLKGHDTKLDMKDDWRVNSQSVWTPEDTAFVEQEQRKDKQQAKVERKLMAKFNAKANDDNDLPMVKIGVIPARVVITTDDEGETKRMKIPEKERFIKLGGHLSVREQPLKTLKKHRSDCDMG